LRKTAWSLETNKRRDLIKEVKENEKETVRQIGSRSQIQKANEIQKVPGFDPDTAWFGSRGRDSVCPYTHKYVVA